MQPRRLFLGVLVAVLSHAAVRVGNRVPLAAVGTAKEVPIRLPLHSCHLRMHNSISSCT